MTSLIDVIFLLLLFFMLSSTFSKFSEVELAGLAGPGAGAAERTLFLQVGADSLRLNARDVALDRLDTTLAETLAEETGQLLVSLTQEVTAQRLTDVLVVLRRRPDLTLSILAPTT
jgi:biopolymer transport protein ExbD